MTIDFSATLRKFFNSLGPWAINGLGFGILLGAALKPLTQIVLENHPDAIKLPALADQDFIFISLLITMPISWALHRLTGGHRRPEYQALEYVSVLKRLVEVVELSKPQANMFWNSIFARLAGDFSANAKLPDANKLVAEELQNTGLQQLPPSS